MPRSVFISYHSKNKALIERIDADLAKRGINVWIDTRNIRPPQLKRDAVYEGIVSSDCFLACLSPEYLGDEFSRTQLFLARAYHKQMLPILAGPFHSGKSPRFDLLDFGAQYEHAVKGLEELDIVDFSGNYNGWGFGTYERNFQKLVEAIQPTPKPKPLNADLIYVSYNYKDTDFATQLAKDLDLARGRVWIDKLSIQLGSNWRSAMYEGLRNARRFVVCLSLEAARSENVRHEVLVAQMRKIPIYPVVTERVYNDDQLKTNLATALRTSEGMGFLNDTEWFKPDPDYQALLTDLKKELGLTALESARRGIFISYRRADSQAITGHIHEKLVEAFGAETVFMDVDSISPGAYFAEYYKNWITDKAAVVLIIIGKQWASIKKDPDGPPRLHEENDHVCAEVATALASSDVRVIPVLVEDARMPGQDQLPESIKRLAQLNSTKVRLGSDFAADITKLIREIREETERNT